MGYGLYSKPFQNTEVPICTSKMVQPGIQAAVSTGLDMPSAPNQLWIDGRSWSHVASKTSSSIPPQRRRSPLETRPARPVPMVIRRPPSVDQIRFSDCSVREKGQTSSAIPGAGIVQDDDAGAVEGRLAERYGRADGPGGDAGPHTRARCLHQPLLRCVETDVELQVQVSERGSLPPGDRRDDDLELEAGRARPEPVLPRDLPALDLG